VTRPPSAPTGGGRLRGPGALSVPTESSSSSSFAQTISLSANTSTWRRITSDRRRQPRGGGESPSSGSVVRAVFDARQTRGSARPLNREGARRHPLETAMRRAQLADATRGVRAQCQTAGYDGQADHDIQGKLSARERKRSATAAGRIACNAAAGVAITGKRGCGRNGQNRGRAQQDEHAPESLCHWNHLSSSTR